MPTNEELQHEVERLGDVVFIQRVIITDLEKRLAKAEHDRKRYREWIVTVTGLLCARCKGSRFPRIGTKGRGSD